VPDRAALHHRLRSLGFDEEALSSVLVG